MVTFFDFYGMQTGVCKSTDEKPTQKTPDGAEIVNGSILYEMDTQSFSMFDKDTETWIPQ